jgi:hypothetical protein
VGFVVGFLFVAWWGVFGRCFGLFSHGLHTCNGFYIVNINFEPFIWGLEPFCLLAWVFYQVQYLRGFKARFKALTV